MMTFELTATMDYGCVRATFSSLWCDYEKEEPTITEICEKFSEECKAAFYNARSEADWDIVTAKVSDDQASPESFEDLIEWVIEDLGYKYSKTRKYSDTHIYEIVIAQGEGLKPLPL